MSLFLAANEPKWGIFMYQDGAVTAVFFSLFSMALTYYVCSLARSGKPIPPIKKLPGLDSIEEAVGRATEMGRPVLMANRSSGLTSAHSMALWGFLSHVAKLCAQYDTRIITLNGTYLAVTVTEEVVRQAYLEAGRPDAFNKEDVRYVPSAQWPWTGAAVGILRREQPAACFWVGSFLAETILLAEVSSQIGAIQIAAVANVKQIPFWMAAVDYCLFGEEEYAASAYLSKNAVIQASIYGEDIAKLIIIGIAILGAILSITQNTSETWLFKALRF